MTTGEQYQLEKMSKLQAETTCEHIYDKILTEGIKATPVYENTLEVHETTLNETKDAAPMRTPTDVAMSIKRLNVVCLVLTIVVIIMATTIGVLLSELKKEATTEGQVDFQDRLAALEENNNTISKVSERIQQHTTKIAQLESDRTNDLATIQRLNTNITDLEDLLAAALEENNNTVSQVSESFQQHTTKIAQLESDRTRDLATIQSLNTSITDLEVQGKQPSYAFSAYSLSNMNPSMGDVLVFDKTLLDEDGVYSSTTGKFTAPVSGLYMFSVTLCTTSSSVYADFVAGGTVIGKISNRDSPGTTASCSSGSATARLQKETQLFLKITYSEGSNIIEDSYRRNSFTGHLLSL